MEAAEQEKWKNSHVCRDAIKTIVAQSREDWPNKIYARMKWTIDRAATATRNLYDNAMICYFTDQPPMLPAFQDGATHFMEKMENWPLLQVKFIGKNFYLIIFKHAEHRESTLSAPGTWTKSLYIHADGLPKSMWRWSLLQHSRYGWNSLFAS